jgi:hypothetical protein
LYKTKNYYSANYIITIYVIIYHHHHYYCIFVYNIILYWNERINKQINKRSVYTSFIYSRHNIIIVYVLCVGISHAHNDVILLFIIIIANRYNIIVTREPLKLVVHVRNVNCFFFDFVRLLPPPGGECIGGVVTVARYLHTIIGLRFPRPRQPLDYYKPCARSHCTHTQHNTLRRSTSRRLVFIIG